MSAAIEAFETQARASARIGSPFAAELCRAIPESMGMGRFATRIRRWPDGAGPDALALRACGGLHALVLTGRAPDLAAQYPPAPFDAAALRAALADTIVEHDAFLESFLGSPPQTNETGRSAMILGAALHVARATGLPLAVHEIGASAGLNLGFSHYGFEFGHGIAWGGKDAPLTVTSDWSGALPPLDQPLEIVARLGCDRNPLDPGDPEDRLRLLAYVWPDQPERLERMRYALDHAARQPAMVARADAADWVEQTLADAPAPGVARLYFHTIVRQYLPLAVHTRIDAAFDRAGARAPSEAPLALFRFENDMQGEGGLMDLTLWPGGETRVLGRAGFHGGWVHWA